MSYEFYVVVHVTGIILTFLALGGAAFHSIAGGTRDTNPSRKLVAMLHGVGLLFVFVAGFGLMARTGMAQSGSWPVWLILKLVIWLALGGVIVVLNRKAGSGRWLIIALPLLGIGAAYLAKFKPFVSTPPALEAPVDGSGSPAAAE
jgi:uncharacterized membrane protein SirB2